MNKLSEKVTTEEWLSLTYGGEGSEPTKMKLRIEKLVNGKRASSVTFINPVMLTEDIYQDHLINHIDIQFLKLEKGLTDKTQQK